MNQKEYNRRRYELNKPAYAALMKFYPLTTDDLDGEIWRPVPDYEDYQISNFGRVKSFWFGKVKILKPVLLLDYLAVTLYKDGKSKMFKVHRLVATVFIPNPDNKPEVNHIDGNKFNNYVGNLEWSTQTENIRHAVANDLIKSGEGNYQAKLTNEQVEYIRNNPDSLNQYELAKKFGVDRRTISKIQLGQKYKNAGGSTRKPQKQPVPEEIKKQIRAEYKAGVVGCGSYALAKKYGVDPSTIRRIVKGR